MITWLKKIFKIGPKRYEPKIYGLYPILNRYIMCEREHNAMHGYIWENSGCDAFNKMPSKKLLVKRYGLSYENSNNLAWYLLEQYFKGNIEIKDEKNA